MLLGYLMRVLVCTCNASNSTFDSLRAVVQLGGSFVAWRFVRNFSIYMFILFWNRVREGKPFFLEKTFRKVLGKSSAPKTFYFSGTG